VSELAFVALGSNLGDRRAHLAQARAGLTLIGESRLVCAGSVEETAPLGAMAQGAFLNQMVVLETTLEPPSLLSHLQRIERSMGRVRSARWAARIIDLDIVVFGRRVMTTPTLTLPHPGLAERTFWQREHAELTQMLAQAA